MEQILITGGTDGIGKGLALMYAARGARVYVAGSTESKGKALEEEAKKIAKGSIIFLKADLSLVRENKRLAGLLEKETDHLDKVIFCAASLKPQPEYRETEEGIEFTFALYYLSRCYLSYRLAALLEKSSDPVIINVAAPGMKGKLYKEDFQMKNHYDGQQAQFHGSRLNDLLGVAFAARYGNSIKYMLFNPMAARTTGAKNMSGDSKIMKLYYKFFGNDVEDLAKIIDEDEKSIQSTGLSAFKLRKPVNLKMETFNKANAKLLDRYSRKLLRGY